MRHNIFLLVLFAGVLSSILSHPVWAIDPNDRLENFQLLSHLGKSHELYYLSDARAVVLMSVNNNCPALDDSLKQFQQTREMYRDKGVEFLLLNSDLGDDRQAIVREAERLGIESPILLDRTQLIGEALGIESSADVFVVDTKSWKLAYRGGTAQLNASLDSVLAGETVDLVSSKPSGCEINFAERAVKQQHAEISYSETIAPILIDNCITCHREGGIGPWVMADYNMIRGFSPMIREVIRTQRMPPWHADPAYGDFDNDRSLSTEEIQTLVHWIEAGSPRGKGPDTLARVEHNWPEWGMGNEPDLVIEIPGYEVPATGIVDYQYPEVTNPLDHDVWVRASEIIPGDRQALHHVITRFYIPDPSARGNGRFGRRGGGLGGYVPGAVARQYPDGTGTLLPAGATINFQMHYTPYGKATSDTSRIGLYFHDEAPAHKMAGTVLMNTKISIPANTKAHTEFKSQVLKRDVLVYSMLPHSHYRGIASDFVAYYPDGTEEILLSVPAYDFNWQTTYVLKEPKVLPAGTKIVHSTTWDNSAQNPANPDPNRTVPWGQQSHDEMLFGAISFRYLEEVEKDSSAGVDQFQGTGSD